MRDARVVVDNKDAKIEKKRFFGEGGKLSGCETVWNNVGGNRTGLAEMNTGLRNHREHVDEEPRE